MPLLFSNPGQAEKISYWALDRGLGLIIPVDAQDLVAIVDAAEPHALDRPWPGNIGQRTGFARLYGDIRSDFPTAPQLAHSTNKRLIGQFRRVGHSALALFAG